MSSNSYFTQDISEFKLPYGRHAGKLLNEVPRPYLHWAYNECDFKYFPEYQRAIEEYLGLTPDPNIRAGNQAAKDFAQSRTNQPAGNPTIPKSGPNGIQRGAVQTGLDAFRAALDRVRREAVAEFADEPELTELVEDLFGRVRRALGI